MRDYSGSISQSYEGTLNGYKQTDGHHTDENHYECGDLKT